MKWNPGFRDVDVPALRYASYGLLNFERHGYKAIRCDYGMLPKNEAHSSCVFSQQMQRNLLSASHRAAFHQETLLFSRSHAPAWERISAVGLHPHVQSGNEVNNS